MKTSILAVAVSLALLLSCAGESDEVRMGTEGRLSSL